MEEVCYNSYRLKISRLFGRGVRVQEGEEKWQMRDRFQRQ